MLRVAVGVQIADGDRLDLFPFQHFDGTLQRRRIERRFYPPVGAQPLTHTKAQLARNQLFGRRQAQIVAVILQALAHLDHVAMAFGRQQPDPRALVLEQRIGRDRGPVHNPLGLAQQRRALHSERLREQAQPVENADRRILGGRRDLGQGRLAGIVNCDEIGKRPADIDPDPVH